MRSRGDAQRLALVVVVVGAAGGLVAVAVGGPTANLGAPRKPVTLSPVENALRALPLRFEPNLGQFESSASFVARGSGFDVALSTTGASLLLHQPGLPLKAIAMRVVGGNASARLEGTGELASVSNYLIGRDPGQWHTRVPNYGAVRYREIYPGIDLLFHGGQGRLEYDFDLSPGADPKAIRIAFDGLDGLSLATDGTLQLAAGERLLSQPPAGMFKGTTGGQEQVAGSYQLLGSREVGFRVERGESRLLIDPVLIYSTYLGGSVADQALAVAVDGAGGAYLAGQAISPDFPTKNPFQSTYRGATGESAYEGNAFVAKFDPSGSSLTYSTYLGGSSASDGGNGDQANGIALDDAGSVFVVGWTASIDFPVTDGGYQLSLQGSQSAFLAELDPTGSNLRYSTYLGGSLGAIARGVAVDGAGKAYLCGLTYSADFPLVQPIESAPSSGHAELGFVAGIDPAVSGTAGLFFSTFLGEPQTQADAIAVDRSGRVYISGRGQLPSVIGGIDAGEAEQGAFVVALTDAGTSVDYMRVIGEEPGASAGDEATALAIDLSGAAYLAGNTNDLIFPTTPSVFQSVNPHAGGSSGDSAEAFVAKLSADGTTWEYATYLGGSSDTRATGIAVDPSCASGCSVTVVGNTDSTDFPTVKPVAAWGDFTNGGEYLSQLDATASSLTFSTSLFLTPAAVTADSSGNVYAAGESGKQMLLLNPFQATSKGSPSAALAKIGATAPAPTVTSVTPSSGTTLGGTSILVTGGYFGTGTTISLGGVSATGVQLLSATQLSAITGPAAAGKVDVTVTNLDLQNASLPSGFTYVAPGGEDGGDAGPDAGDAGATDGGVDAGDGGQMKADSGPADSGSRDSGPIEDSGASDAGAGNSSSGCGSGSGGSPGTLPIVVTGVAGGLMARRRRRGSSA